MRVKRTNRGQIRKIYKSRNLICALNMGDEAFDFYYLQK